MAEETQAIVEAPAPAAGGATAAPETPPQADPAAGAPERDPNKVYTQEEVDKIAKKVKQNERYRTKREIEAFYQGRESRPAEQPVARVEAPVAAVEEKAPERDKFDSYEAFLEAKAEYAGRKASADFRAKEEATAKEAKAKETAQQKADAFRTKLNEKYADIGARAQDIAHVVIPAHVVEAMHESDFGPDILNSFVDNPKELERIAALSPSAALREIGRLEARLEAAAPKAEATTATAPAAQAPSRAPAPIKVVGGTAVKTDDEPSHDKPDEWRAWRDKQAAKRKAGGSK